jgi:PAS domain S-box-containing protein
MKKNSHFEIDFIIQNNYDVFFQLNPIPIFIYNVDSLAIIDVNAAAVSNYGFSKEEFLSMSLKDIRPEEDVPRLLDHIAHDSQAVRVSNSWRHKKKDGTLINVEVISYSLPTANGENLRLVMALDVTEKYKLHRELEESENKYKSLFENAAEAIFYSDKDGNILFANPKASELLGYSQEELTKMNVATTYLKGEENYAINRIIELKEKRNLNFERKMRKKDGSLLEVEISLSLFDDGHCQGIVRDISERKEKEKLLRESEQKFRILAETSRSGIFIYQGSKFKYVNPDLSRFTGYSAEELYNMDFIDMVHPDFREMVRERSRKRLEGIDPHSKYEFKVVTKKGDEKWVYFAGGIIVYEGKRAVIGNIFDITQQKETEFLLRNSEERFRILTETSKSAVFIFDECGFKYVNPATVELTGYSLEDYSKMKFWDMIHPDFSEVVMERGKKRLLGENTPFENEVKILTKDGKTKWFEYKSSNIVFEGKPAMLGNAFDITERKNAEIKLQESEARFSAFMDNMPVGVFIKDGQGNFVFLNKQFEKAHGANMLGQTASYATNLPKYIADKIAEDDRKALKEGMLNITETIPDINGELRIYNTTKFTINRPDQTPLLGCYQIDNTEKIQAQEELLKSKMEYQSFFEDDLTGDFISTSDGKILKCNPAFLRIFGFSSQNEVMDFNITDLYQSPQDRVNLIEKLKINKRLENISLEMKRTDGKHIYVIENILGTFNKKGELVEIKGYIVDETERKIAEAQVNKISVAIEQSPVSIIITDKSGVIEYVNPKFLSITGYTLEEVLGKNPRILKTGHTTPEEYKNLWQTISKGNVWQGELLNKKKDGTLFWESASISPVRNQSGQIVNFIAVKEDITSRKESKEKIKFLALALENINESVTITDPNNVLIYVNHAFREEYGYSEEEIIGEHIGIVYSDKNKDGIGNEILKGTLGKGWKGELINKKKNGEEFPVFLSTSAILNDDGTPSALIGVSSDITERKKVEQTLILAKEKAEEINRIKDIFFANMSHELRTPLVGILGYAELMKKEVNDEKIIEMADVIYEGGKRLNDTLNLILDLSKVEAIGSESQLKLTDINKIIHESEKLFRAAAREKNLDIIIYPGDKNILANVDPDMFMKAINNLLHNAIKFTGKGIISIQSFAKNDKVKVIISDTGIGISEEDQKKIFEPFRQASEGSSRRFEGTGLGLTITKKMINLMHGEISVSSKLGTGSSFVIELPQPKSPEKNKKQTETTHSERKRLLLVENDALNNKVILSFLQDNYEIDSVFNGEDAIKKTEDYQYDCILMDIGLGDGIGGLETTRQIRKNKLYTSTPIIAITAFAMKEDRERILCGGCTQYLPKPFSKEQIVKLIDGVMSKS